MNDLDDTDDQNSNNSSVRSNNLNKRVLEKQNSNKTDSFEDNEPHWSEWCATGDNSDFQKNDIFNLLDEENEKWLPSVEKLYKSNDKIASNSINSPLLNNSPNLFVNTCES